MEHMWVVSGHMVGMYNFVKYRNGLREMMLPSLTLRYCFFLTAHVVAFVFFPPYCSHVQ